VLRSGQDVPLLLRLKPLLRIVLIVSFVLLGAGWWLSIKGSLPALGSVDLSRLVAGAGPGARAAAPEFSFTTFDGRRLSLGDPSLGSAVSSGDRAEAGQTLAGKAVVLNFWASWCVPCRAEMPYFESTYRAYQDRGVVFVGLAVQDDPEASRRFIGELGITYPAGPDSGNEIATRYQLTGLPTTIFITRDGKVARKWLGSLSEQQLAAFVEEIAS
jgi:thiol-disulfide isomerase/thioredoxin